MEREEDARAAEKTDGKRGHREPQVNSSPVSSRLDGHPALRRFRQQQGHREQRADPHNVGEDVERDDGGHQR